MRARRTGQALAEWAVVLPAALLLTLGIVQFALVLIGKTVVNHAAFVATRAELVGEDPLEAAVLVCAPVSGTKYAGGAEIPDSRMPGWGTLPRSGRSASKTQLSKVTQKDAATGNSVTAEIVHDFELTIPVVDLLFRSRRPDTSVFTTGVYGGPAGSRVGSRADVARGAYLRFTEKCTLPRPWSREADLGLPE